MDRIFYVTRDIERAAGLLGVRDDFFIITNPNPLAEALYENYHDQILLVRGSNTLSTLGLVRDQIVQTKVRELSGSVQPNILVFKNSLQIERECESLGWRLLNPPAELSGKIENKISQYAWLREGKSKFIEMVIPLSETGEINQFDYKGLLDVFGDGFIIQYNIGHTGTGTKRIFNERDWMEETERFPKRVVKISQFIEGTMYTINACVMGDQVICGSTSEQITGMPLLTNNKLATVGNDWSVVLPEIHEKVENIASEIGDYLMRDGWKGLFGIDVIMEKGGNAGLGHLIEINARQPASSTMESQLQNERGEVSMMERHVGALTGSQKSKVKSQKYGVPMEHFSGFQLFFRNLETRPVQLKNEFVPGCYRISEKGIEFIRKAMNVAEAREGELFAFSASKYDAVKPGGELLRIQSKNGMIKTLGKLPNTTIQSIRAPLIPHD